MERYAVVLLCEPLEAGGGFRLAQIAQDDEHCPVREHGGKLIKFLDECGLLVESIVAQLV